MLMTKDNKFGAKKQFELDGKKYNYYALEALEKAGLGKISRLPFSIRILLESVLRQHDGYVIKYDHVTVLMKWGTRVGEGFDVTFMQYRVILQDFTFIHAVIALAALR